MLCSLDHGNHKEIYMVLAPVCQERLQWGDIVPPPGESPVPEGEARGARAGPAQGREEAGGAGGDWLAALTRNKFIKSYDFIKPGVF